MKMVLKKIHSLFLSILFLIILLVIPNIANATHYMGGNVQYQCIGPNTYNIFVSIFRDCNGADFDLDLDINIESSTCNINTTYSAPLVSNYPQIVTPLCPGQPDACLTPAGTYGVEFYFYKITVTIPDGCPDIVISVNECCRNNAITTLNNTGDIFFYTTMDTQNATCNSSPVFSPELTPFICLGESITFNQFATDPDGDDLVFSLTDCLENNINDPVAYQNPPFSALNPLNSSTPVIIDPTTGIITFTPTALDVGVLCVLVEEFRNGVKISETLRDIQFTVINCPPNDAPVVSGFDGQANATVISGDYQLNVCWDQQLCYNIEAFDLNNQNIELTFNTNTSGVTFTTTANNTPNATAQFCWTPTTDDLGLNYFIITATDDACPIKLSNTFTYIINVNAQDYSDYTYVQDSVNCIGGSDGGATVTLTGNLSPNPQLTWLTEPNQLGFTATGLSAGTYDVLLSDDSLGCPGLLEVEINEPTPIVLSQGPAYNSIDCTIGNDGVLDVTAVGGTSPYTYEWSDGALTQVNSNLTAGTYTVTVSDYYGCTESMVFFLQNQSDLIISAFSSNYGGYGVTCNGYNDGFINLFTALGVAPYTYLWSNGEVTEDLANITAGTYTVTVTDAAGCVKITSRTLTEPDGFTISSSVQNAACTGGGLGSITVSASGAPQPYTYTWTNAVSTTNLATDLVSGTYTVTISDDNGCTTTISETVTSSSSLNLNQGLASADVSCNGGSDGVLEVEIIGGTAPVTYAWSNTETTALISNLTQGDYTVTASDGSGCVATATYSVSEPTALQMSSTLSDFNTFGVSCFGANDGSIMTTTTDGTGPYTYLWSNTETTSDITNLTAGFYTITVSDANSCTITGSFEITNPIELTSSISVGGATCSGGGDGSATVSPTGGSAPYIYLWSNSQTTATATGLIAQTYTVTITDDLGCTATNSINVAEPPLLSVSASGTDASCFGGADGTVTALGNGGDGNYTYNWNIPASGAIQNGLLAGTYTVTISDGNNCTATNTVTIGEATPITVTEVITATSCSGSADGSVNITVAGGTAPYTFAWSDGSTAEDCLNVIAGLYTVSISDTNGCTYTNSYTVTEPSALDIILNPSDVFCLMGSDGNVDATYSGGTMPYTYAWSNSEVTEDLSNIPSGDYTVTVSDANGCTLSAMTTVSEPSTGISLSMSANQTICFGATNGSANVTASGGSPGYTYLWSNAGTTSTLNNVGGGTYTVTVTDLNNCTASSSVMINELSDINIVLTSTSSSCDSGNDGTATITNISGGAGTVIGDYTILWATSPSQNTATATGLIAGQTYSVTVTDGNGCTGTNTVVVPSPTPMSVNMVNTVPVSCSGESDGSVTVSGAGGSTPYTYAWSDGQTGDQAINLTLGTYTVTVSDVSGCTATASFGVDNPQALDATIVGVDATCKGWANGAATAYPTGGVPPYSYDWSDGQTTEYVEFLAEGSYNVTVTDANSCMFAASVYIGEPDWLTYTTTVVDVTCNGDRDGSIQIEGAGGTPPYMYSFDSGATFDNADIVAGLFPGEYGIVVQDGNGCETLIDTLLVNEPLPLVVTIFNGDVASYDLEDSIQLSVGVDNSIGNTTFAWTALYGDQDMSCTDCPFPWVTGYENNRFEVVVTDDNGCTGTAEIELIVNRNREIFVPGGFTPNNDGMNDYLMVHGTSGTRVKTFRVYDRWGELMFRADKYDINSESPEHIWNGNYKGKMMNSSVFVWYVEVRYVDGREEAFEGSSTLVR